MSIDECSWVNFEYAPLCGPSQGFEKKYSITTERLITLIIIELNKRSEIIALGYEK
jgi:hypothetical protein